MNRREFLLAAGGASAAAYAGLPKLAQAAEPADRGLLIAVDENAPDTIHDAAHLIATSKDNPLIQIFAGSRRIEATTSQRLLAGSLADRALNHLILIGLPGDPLIRVAWQREAREKPEGFYIFGFGTFKGDIGYIESDRNLFLHSTGIDVAPFETEIVTITGTTPAGVQLACDAFLSRQLINGVVGAAGWTRPVQGLLDRDALAPGFPLPEQTPASIGDFVRVGYTHASEDEYRGVLADTGASPRSIWRAKYYKAGVWDRADAAAAMDAYSYGLHRRAYGHTRWVAEFGSEGEAASAAPKIAAAAHLNSSVGKWTGLQPYYGWVEAAKPGPLALWQENRMVLMSTLPEG